MAIEVRIASPCEESWASMQGDARSRFCQRCSLTVFDLTALTEQEVRALITRTDGRLCARLHRRADGTVLTRDCPTGVSRVRRRGRQGLMAAVALVLALVGWRAATRPEHCEPDDFAGGWFDTLVSPRLLGLRETLRQTRTFGPLVDKVSPLRSTMGRISTIRVIRGSEE